MLSLVCGMLIITTARYKYNHDSLYYCVGSVASRVPVRPPGRAARGQRRRSLGPRRGVERRREELSLRRVARGAPAVELDARVGRHAQRRRAAAGGRAQRRGPRHARAQGAAHARVRRHRFNAQLLQHLPPNTATVQYLAALRSYCTVVNRCRRKDPKSGKTGCGGAWGVCGVVWCGVACGGRVEHSRPYSGWRCARGGRGRARRSATGA